MPLRFSCAVRRLVFLAVVGSAGTVFAQTPVNVGAAARGKTSVDRALESRARVLDRARLTGRAAANAARDHAGDVRGKLPTAAGSAAGTGSATISTDRGPGAAASFGLESAASLRNGHASPQLGNGRFGAELHGGADVRLQHGGSRSDRTARTQAETKGRGGLGLGLGLGWFGRDDRRPQEQQTDGGVHVDAGGDTAAEVRLRGRGHDPDRILNQAETHFARRLAQIDRMRDRAVELGDEALLQQADKLEVLARAQFEQRTTGEHTVGAAMRTFNEQRNRPEADDEPAATAPADSTTTAQAGVETNATVDAGVAAGDGTIVQTEATVEADVSAEAEANTSAGPIVE